ncbi:MAG: type II toxin-antitoxin system HicB family antitoxin [Patescibacteria group bacterium]
MYTAVYKKVRGGYAAWIEEISGVNTQGKTKQEARENLQDALKMMLAAQRELSRKESRGDKVERERFVFAE